MTTPALLIHIHLYSHSGSCTDPRNCYWGESAQLKGGRFKKKVTKRVHKAGGEEVADSKRREKGSSDIIIGWQRKRTGVDELGARS